MLNKKQNGFSVVELLIILVVLGLIVFVALFVYRKNNQSKTQSNNTTSNSGEVAKNDDNLALFNLGIANMDEVNVTTAATRDFTASGHKGFYIFGDILPGTPVRHNPNFEYASMKEGSKVISAIEGVVGFIKQQPDSNDYEVFLMTSEKSRWVIGYDHLTELKVKKGDKVKVGDTLGVPARQNNGLLRFEFQVNKDDGTSNAMHVCPVTLLDKSVKNSWVEQLQSSQAKWEQVTGLELYDTSKQDPAGCLMKEMSPAYAEGR